MPRQGTGRPIGGNPIGGSPTPGPGVGTTGAQRGDRITARAWNSLWALAKRGARPLRVVENSGLTLRDGPDGQVLGTDMRARAAAAETSQGVVAQQFKITNVSQSDVIEGKFQTGSTTDSPEVRVKIAKPWFLRGQDTWGGKTRKQITYTNFEDGGQTRTALSATEFEIQTIVPEYRVNDIIVAVKANTGIPLPGGEGGETVKWLDLNTDGRMWMVIP